MSERDWIPAHRRLFKGAKKGWPRAVRFILLELCHEARPTNGVLEFPVEWDTLTAVHDRIGGSRKEIRVALAKLQETDSTGTQVIQIERDQTEHRLKIVKWDSWSGPKSSAERVEAHRKRIVKNATALQAFPDVTPTGEDRREEYRREESATPSPVQEESQSQTRLRSVPPPPPESGADPEILTLAAAIRAEAKLAHCCDPRDLAERALPVAGRKPTAWLLQAVKDAAAVTPPGEQAHATLRRLWGFLRAARAPWQEHAEKLEAKSGPAYREDDDPVTIQRLRRMPQRLTAQDQPVSLAELAGKLKQGA